MEGLESLKSCPNYRFDTEADLLDDTSLPDTKDEADAELSCRIDLPAGDNLNISTCEVVMNRSHGRVVFVAGLAESGKTTLLAELYEKFQRGPFSGYLFAGSSTLIGFEYRCFLSRTCSGEDSPETERTKIGDQILHFTVAREKDISHRVEMLFTDLAGELFRQAKNSVQACQELHLLKRADHVALLINGDRLPDATKRHSAFGDCEHLLGRMLDAEMITKSTFVDIVITKYDKWHKCESVPAFMQFMKSKKKSLTKKFSNRVNKLRVLHVAARPDSDSEIEHGLNLDSLFNTWVEETAVAPVKIEEPTLNSPRMYDHFSSGFEQIVKRK